MLASVTPLQNRGIRCRSQLARRPVPVVRAQAASTVRELLDDISAAKLGKVRFIVLGDGAILESVSDWGRLVLPGSHIQEDFLNAHTLQALSGPAQDGVVAIVAAHNGQHVLWGVRVARPRGQRKGPRADPWGGW